MNALLIGVLAGAAWELAEGLAAADDLWIARNGRGRGFDAGEALVAGVREFAGVVDLALVAGGVEGTAEAVAFGDAEVAFKAVLDEGIAFGEAEGDDSVAT